MSDALEDRARARHVEEREKSVRRLPIHLPREFVERKNRLRFGRKNNPPLMERVVQRLDAESIPYECEAFRAGLPQGISEHSDQLGRKRRTPFEVAVEENLGVGTGRETVPR